MKTFMFIVLFVASIVLSPKLFAWEYTDTKRTNLQIPVDEFCRKVATYTVMEATSSVQHRKGVNFTTANEEDRETISKAMMRNSEECYMSCLKKVSQKY